MTPLLAAWVACAGDDRSVSGSEAEVPPFARAVRGSAADEPAAGATAVQLELGPDLVGVCDASAAIVLGDTLVVADDEHNVLHTFAAAGFERRSPVELAALAPAFGEDEADLEGMAQLADGAVWLIGSHDTGKGDQRKPSRQRLFALRPGTLGLGDLSFTLAHGPTDGLLPAMEAHPTLGPIVAATIGVTAKDPQGLSIEGLAAGPGSPDGSLWIGFRAPAPGGSALVVRLDEPATFAEGAPARLSDPIRLDLGGRGIRSFEADGAGGYLLIAGPSGSEGASAVVYRWGGPGTEPVRVEVAFGDLVPEALVRVGDAWWVLSDDGRREIDGQDCKKQPAERRRARTARLVGL